MGHLVLPWLCRRQGRGLTVVDAGPGSWDVSVVGVWCRMRHRPGWISWRAKTLRRIGENAVHRFHRFVGGRGCCATTVTELVVDHPTPGSTTRGVGSGHTTPAGIFRILRDRNCVHRVRFVDRHRGVNRGRAVHRCCAGPIGVLGISCDRILVGLDDRDILGFYVPTKPWWEGKIGFTTAFDAAPSWRDDRRVARLRCWNTPATRTVTNTTRHKTMMTAVSADELDAPELPVPTPAAEGPS